MTVEEWLARELAKLPPLTPEVSRKIADAVISELDNIRRREKRKAA